MSKKIRLKELNSLKKSMTPRIEFFWKKWFKEKKIFLEKKKNSKNWTFFMTQRIESFFLVKKIDTLNWTLLFNMTHRIEPFFSTWLKELNFFFEQYDSKNCTFLCKIWLNLLNLFAQYGSKNWTLSYEKTQRIELFIYHDSQNWTFFNLTHRIQPFFSTRVISTNWTFSVWLMELNLLFMNLFSIWLKEMNSFQYDSKKWTRFNMTQRTELVSIWLKELNLFLNEPLLIWVQELNLLFSIRHTELNLFFP